MFVMQVLYIKSFNYFYLLSLGMDILIITLFVGFAHYTLTQKWNVPYLSCFWCFSFWVSLFLFTANMNPLNNIPEFMITCIIKAGACTYLGSLINLWRSNY